MASITDIDDRTSTFQVKLDCYYFWYDPAVTAYLASTKQDNIWYPSLEPLEMLDYDLLRVGSLKFIGESSTQTIAQMYGNLE